MVNPSHHPKFFYLRIFIKVQEDIDADSAEEAKLLWPQGETNFDEKQIVLLMLAQCFAFVRVLCKKNLYKTKKDLCIEHAIELHTCCFPTAMWIMDFSAKEELLV
jgi:hypothetical protein